MKHPEREKVPQIFDLKLVTGILEGARGTAGGGIRPEIPACAMARRRLTPPGRPG
jgi:hypothetical protein